MGADGCIRGGLACLKSDPSVRCVVIASFKGHTPGDMQAANYGMSSPAGYRKALRLMRLAERFGLPVITLVDTCGALPSFSAERDGQSEAIATNLTTMAGLRVPIVTIVAGEGGSGGAAKASGEDQKPSAADAAELKRSKQNMDSAILDSLSILNLSAHWVFR